MAEAAHDEVRAQGDLIVARARLWIGTPYRHQASCRGAGADCLGLVRGVWREVRGAEPEEVPPYTADWSEAGGPEDLLNAARRNLRSVAREEAAPGDILVLRMIEGGLAKHVGILGRAPGGFETLIHAYSGHGVVESPLTPAWRRRVAGAFRFPR
ncbi:NlpC/P60 family protein [Amaricoccus solimangrovi]|uniref:Peptidase n=1 Tax=Amaricoccus solimangrovi TaxID=2589815 RepID=A0A501WTP8_9RHOB|nr:NlpC/P60 family protein [Amaricoccus solimangrovi]TPE50717.1 peptidase [Amaricoccus solimangrovi]